MTVQNTPNPSAPAPVPVVYPSCLYPSWWASATTVEIDTNHGATGSRQRTNVEIFPWGVSMTAEAGLGGNATLYSWFEVQDIHMTS